jgi:hypothetical protein
MSDDRTTGQGTRKGHHGKPGDDVTEGGVPPAPTEGRGMAKPSASNAAADGLPDGDTSAATAGKAEKEHAAEVGAQKTQSGRGHRKD